MDSRPGQIHKHIIALRIYLTVAVTLLILTALTVRVSMIHLGGWNAVAALAIAAAKGLLAALFFMHLLYDRKIYLIVLEIALVTLAIFITLTLFDTLQRGGIYTIEQNPIRPDAKIYQQAPSDSLSPETQQGQ